MAAPTSCLQFLEHPEIFGQKFHCHAGATTLFIGFRPCDFFLFPKFKEVLKRTHFQDSTTIKVVVTKEFRTIPEESS